MNSETDINVQVIPLVARLNGQSTADFADISRIIALLTRDCEAEHELSAAFDISHLLRGRLEECLRDPSRRSRVKNWTRFVKHMAVNCSIHAHIVRTDSIDAVRPDVLALLTPFIEHTIRRDHHGSRGAEDFVQDTTISLLKLYLKDLRVAESIDNWIALAQRCARSAIINDWRAEQRRPMADSNSVQSATSLPESNGKLCSEGISEACRKAVERLPDDLRTCQILRLDDFSLKQIAVVCGIPVGTVKSRLKRARAKLFRDVALRSELDLGPIN